MGPDYTACTSMYAITVMVCDCQNPRFHNVSVAALGEVGKNYDFYLEWQKYLDTFSIR